MKGWVSEVMLVTGLLVAVVPCAALAQDKAQPAAALPQGALRAGTWTSELLRKDAMLGALSKAATSGCTEPQDMTPYISQEPVGETGARAWTEIWMIKCTSGTVPVNVRFHETPDGGADYSIR